MARFGEEKFVVLLPEKNIENSLTTLNRTRERLAKTQLRSKNSEGQNDKLTGKPTQQLIPSTIP